MKAFHTSPNEITNIKATGTFDDCLFFSHDVYTMTASNTVYVYSLELNEEHIVRVSDLYDEELIAHISDVLSVDEEVAERMLDGRDTAFDHGLDGEDDWWIQAKQGECAKRMGYKAVEAQDEQGTVFIVPMLGCESELTLEEVR
ncbi:MULTISPECIES: hypothetical protein [Pseudoalteromonas]|uniref:Uncharacterized protein n=1 Tax=Pseudoalteromonas amylolytica TaxID=1859457 RepID=A0A1S1MX13_9GAMM|nr:MULTISPECIES: hypothetical protein [Pseudoalteromonas]OHU85539.1 hypothetical protein BFC16_19515 [Pseudoalteromonas sp. JW3]OHU91773.1 hypothetical protein BET10_08210 [Pseudoalteromonas amylolytica]